MQRLPLGLIIGLAVWMNPAGSFAQLLSPGDAGFAQLTEYLAGYLAWRPLIATAIGLHEHDGKITDFSRVSLDAELQRLRRFDQRLARFSTNNLSARGYYDFRILRAAIRKERFEFEDLQVHRRNPMVYAGALDVNVYVKREFAPLSQRVRAVTAILQQAPRIMAAARTNLAEALPKPYLETAIQVGEGTVAFLEKDLVTAFASLNGEPVAAEFRAANQTAVTALRQFIAFLQEQKLPQATEVYGLGRDAFARMLSEAELVTFSPERILEIGQAQLHREQAIFKETARQIDPAQTPIEVFRAIQRDHPTEASLIADTTKHLEGIRQFLVTRDLVTVPSEVRARVEETPAFMRATSFASMDTPGPFETKATEAYYYVTPPEKDWPAAQKEEWLTAFNYYTTDVVSIHEAYPGHYLQQLCLNASPATRLEKTLSSYAFVEGWAHYTEQMMLEEGFGGGGTDPAGLRRAAKYRLAQSDEALLRLCRLCVAIRMHCQGMTVDQATRFFMENCYYEEKPARQEATRGAYDPGYLHYTLGKLMILKLRDDYRKQEGAGFSLKQFHDALLRRGMPPIPLLREVLLKDSAQWGELLEPPRGSD